MLTRDRPRRANFSSSAAAEEHLRSAGRLLEVAGVCDDESARMAQVIFRIASRVRSDRLAT